MRILLLGSRGQIGWELGRALLPLAEVTAPGRVEADFADPEKLRAVVRRASADVIVNAAAFTQVDDAEDQPAQAMRVNAEAVSELAAEAARTGAWLVHYSTDYVFAGDKDSPYREEDAAGPLNAYGRSKLAGEQAINAAKCRHLILRTSWIYASRGRNFLRSILARALAQDHLAVVDDQTGAPTAAELVADVTALCLSRIHNAPALAESVSGTYHLSASGETSWHGFARFILGAATTEGLPLKLGPQAVTAISSRDYPQRARRPANSRLSCTRLEKCFGLRLPPWQANAARVIHEIASEARP